MNNLNTLFVAWNGTYKGLREWKPVGKLEFIHGEPTGFYRFRYTRGALNGFQPFVGMKDVYTVYESDDLFPLFTHRLLPKSRPEYEQYLRWSGFELSDQPTPIDILGIMEGKRVTDYVEVFPYPNQIDGYYVNRFFLHGINKLSADEQERVAHLNDGEHLHVVTESSSGNSNGVAQVYCDDGVRIGCLPRYLVSDVKMLLEQCGCRADVIVEQNNADAPALHRVLCRMTSCWPDDFAPYSGDEFLPLVDV